MPRETLDIRLFNHGIYARPDSQDIPIESASDSDNVDGDLYEGRLGGIPGNDTTRTLGFDATNYAWLKRTAGNWDLVYATDPAGGSPTIKAIKDFYGTPAASGTTAAVFGTTLVAQHQAVHIGTRDAASTYIATAPYWIGWIAYGQFGGSAPTELTAVTAALPQPTNGAGYAYVSASTPHAGTMVFDSTKIYEYTNSLVYDGFQESPLNGTTTTYTPSSEGDADYVTVSVTANTVASLSKRVSAVKVYRREKDTTTGNYTLWRLLGTLDIVAVTDAISGTTEGGKTFTWSAGASRVASFTDDNSFIGGTYEAETGIPETLTSSIVYYEISADVNNYLFTGRCVKSGIPDASRYIFRSKSFRYDMFDWTNDYLILPTIPVAMKAYNGRLFVWDENDTYIINPETLQIEDVINGMGCLASRSVAVSEYGMFWCDRKNAFWFDGTRAKIISEPIKTASILRIFDGSVFDWHGFSYSYSNTQATLFRSTPVVMFNSAKNTVLFIIPYVSGTTSNVWAYNVIKNRWDKYLNYPAAATTGASSGGVVGRGGECYWADGATNLIQLLVGSTKKVFTWYSQTMTFDDVSQKKVFYHLIYDYSGSAPATVNYSIDNGSNWRSLTNTTEIKDANGAWEKKKTLKIKLIGNANGTTVINNIGVVFRRYVGKRD